MKVLMISTDARITDTSSKEFLRMKEYASVLEELHIIVCTTKTEVEEMQEGNLFVYPTLSRNKLFYGINSFFLAKKLKSNTLSLVSAQDPFETGLIALFISQYLNVPLEVQIHTDFLSPYFLHSFKNYIRVFLARVTLPRAEGVRVVSERLAREVKKWIFLKSEPVVLPLVPEEMSSVDELAALYLKRKYPQFGEIVLMLSRLEFEKDVTLAITAFRNATAEARGVGLIIVGEGSEEVKLKTLVVRLKLEDRVFFEKWQQDPIPYFMSADVFLNTSLYEGYGRTLIEAALVGCPIVTTEVGVVGNELSLRSVLVSEPKNLLALTKNLAYALSHKKELKEIAVLQSEKIKEEVRHFKERRLALFKEAWERSLKVV